MSASFPAYVDGRVLPADQATISPLDQGFQLGLSVFDTLLWEEETLYFVEQHLARLRRGVERLGIPWPPPHDPGDALRCMARAVGPRPAALRVTVTRGVPDGDPGVVVTAKELAPPPDPGVRVWITSYQKLGGEDLETLKTTNRLRNVLAVEEARAHGAWEALLPTHEGDLTEGTVSNLFAVLDGVLLTPATERGCLAGVVQGELLRSLEHEPLALPAGREPLAVRLDRIEPADLGRVSEVFLTNTTGRLIPVVEVLGVGVGRRGLPGSAGPITGALRERFARIEAAYREHAHPAVAGGVAATRRP